MFRGRIGVRRDGEVVKGDMDSLFPFLSPLHLFFALLIGVGSGFIKGVVGFGMPLVMISGLTLFIAPEFALAGLILPTLMSNVMQSTRYGSGAVWQSVKEFRVFLLCGGVTLVIAAQFVLVVADEVLKLMIGVLMVCFSALQLSKYTFQITKRSLRTDAAVGGVTGVIGGMSGMWGAPTVAYLTALNTEKSEQMRLQGVIYGLGAVALLGAHIGSGVLRAETWPFSAMLIPPAILGMWLGGKVVDGIDQQMFRRATLIVLLVAGLNLVRRALF